MPDLRALPKGEPAGAVRGDADAETEANLQVQDLIPRLQEVVLR
ncbi:MAG: hypothetical protein ACLQDY_31500 [Streptosporangiaceae bacterium]